MTTARLVCFVSLFALGLPAAPLVMAASDSPENLAPETLASELEATRRDISLVASNLALQTQRLQDIQSDLAKRDNLLAHLMEDYRGWVREASVLRGQLATQMESRVEWQAAAGDRRTALERLRASPPSTALPGETLDDAAAVEELDAHTRAAAGARATEEGLLRLQHELSYSDPECARLRQAIKQLEVQINQCNSAIVERAQLDPAWREARKSRQGLLNHVKTMRVQEQVLRRELERATAVAGVPGGSAEVQ